jgi:hypothetical protein
MNIQIFDPAMCCSSGMCGPDIDPVLVKMNDAVLTLKKQGVKIARYNLAQQPKEFLLNKTIADLLHKKGKKSLPVTIINGEVFLTGRYATYEELCKKLGIEPMKGGKPMTLMS